MDAGTALSIARDAHRGQRDRYGEPLIDHVERVADDVPDEAKVTAYLHELLERTDVPAEWLADGGVTLAEAAAIELLTRRRGETYAGHVLRIADAPGPAGTLARIVKLADLGDHLRHARRPGEPPYGWAQEKVREAGARHDHAPTAA
jgi:hypothetical protein